MDPVSLVLGATAIFNSIKSAVDQGRDMMETAEKVGNLFSKVAQIVTVASSPVSYTHLTLPTKRIV